MVAEAILGTIGSRRHGGAVLEADPVAAGDCKRVDFVGISYAWGGGTTPRHQG